MPAGFRYGFDLSPGDERLLRGPLPPQARKWVRAVCGPGARIVSEHARGGGAASAVHAVTVDDARGRHRLVLRRYVRAEWLAKEPDLAAHEARVLDLLAPTPVAAPRLVAVDDTGDECDVPAVLMTHLPGRVRWSPRDVDGFLDGLVDALLAIHAVTVPPVVTVRPFRPYHQGRRLAPPSGTSVPEAWHRAIEVHAGALPAATRVFVHRDFHPGNVLWVGEAPSAVVDWCNASIGAPETDVAHCRVNLTYGLGIDAAEGFTARWLARSGRRDYDPSWDLVDAVSSYGDASGPDPGWLPALDEVVRRAFARLD